MLLLPKNESSEIPELSLVIPALNEELTIEEFIAWCMEGFAAAKIRGEILIVDSSTDQTADRAIASGARVLKTPKRGLGRAYIEAIPHIRGRYVIMGDCDLTYDFRNLLPFIEKLNEGTEFVMGTRMKGRIESGAMPALHRYFGTPLTTFILNRIYGTSFSDIHCGMRALTLEALRRINLHSESWEYASEMIVKAVRLKLRIDEVPINFYKDRDGRLSHHRRSGWLSPWKAGWVNLRAMFTYAPDLVFVPPGIALLFFGLGGGCLLAFGPIPTPWLTLSLNTLLFCIALAVLGMSLVTGGLTVKLYYNFDQAFSEKFYRRWTYDRLMGLVGTFLGLGLLPVAYLVAKWLSAGFSLSTFSFMNVFGLELIMLGAQLFSFTLMIETLRQNRY